MQKHPLYYSLIDEIYHPEWVWHRLERIRLLQNLIYRELLKDREMRFIHIAGTNGKGSVAKFLEMAISRKEKAGSITGPHLYDYRERFSVNNENPEPLELVRIWEEIKPLCLENKCSFAEITLIMGISYFVQKEVKIGIIETGVGGRYDKSNAIKPFITAITQIGEDHIELLGKEKWQRAIEKAGIIKPYIPLFTAERDIEILKIFEEICRFYNSPMFVVSKEEKTQAAEHLKKTGLPEYQTDNLALAYRIVKYIYPEYTFEQFLDSIKAFNFPGRFEIHSDGIIIDVAHNPDKFRSFLNSLYKKFPSEEKFFLIGISGSRKFEDFLKLLQNYPYKKVILTGNFYRSAEIKNVKKFQGKIEIVEEPLTAFEKLKQMRKGKELIIITGSAYLIDYLFNPDRRLAYLNKIYGWRLRRDNR